METPRPVTPSPTHSEIAAKAYALWQQDGCQPGRDMDHWLRAEALLNRNDTRAVSSPLASKPQPTAPAPRQARKPAATRRASNRQQAA